MRLSCLPVSFFEAISKKQMPLEAWMDFAAELRLDGVECGPLLIEPLGPAKPDEFRRLAASRGLAVSNYTAYSDFTNPDQEARRREVAAMIANIAVARDLGSGSLRALTGQQRPGLGESQAIGWIVDCIRTVADAAAKAGIRLNLENHTKAFTWTDFDFAIKGEKFLEVLDALKDAPVGVQFDTANPLVAGEETLPLFEKVRDRIGYVHINDVARRAVFEFVTVGTGIAPIREVLERLSQQGYAGWVGIEEASRTGKAGFTQAVSYTRDVLKQLNR
jgi:sugar phosphate isomerase/epimerase